MKRSAYKFRVNIIGPFRIPGLFNMQRMGESRDEK